MAGNSIVIFPEGTRSADGTIGPFKKGGLLLSVRSGAPLVPVTLLGTGNIIKKGSGIIKPGRIHIIISPPISQTVADFVDCQHSRDTFSPYKLADRMPAFEAELSKLLAPHASDGQLSYSVRATVTWGRIRF